MARKSRTEKNMAILNDLTKQEEIIEEPEEKIEKKKTIKHKSFTCECGMHVELYGEAEENKCLRCRDEK
jgi:hypothetical protein